MTRPSLTGSTSEANSPTPTKPCVSNRESEALQPYLNPVDAALSRRPQAGGRLLLLASALFVVVMLVWAAFAELDEVVHASGQVIPSQRTQNIQNLEGGILRAMLVHEGQIVDAGTPLAQLDNEFAESNLRDVAQRVLEQRIALARLEAELNNAEPQFTDEMRRDAPQTLADHEATFKSRMGQRLAEMDVLESQYRQREQDLAEQMARKKQLESSLNIAMEKRDLTRPLMERRTFPRVEYLALEQQVVQLRGDADTLAAAIPRTQAAIREARQRVNFRKAELETAVSEEIGKRRAELQSLLETMTAGGDRVTRTELRSPVRGTVKQVLLHTTGGVVKPGESILEIVPLTDNLVIEARVRPSDVAFLRPEQAAMVKFTAYDFSIYGGLSATLEHMSADTIEDKRGDPYYIVHLKTRQTSIIHKSKNLPIIPGMMVTVDVLTGKKTVLDYLLKPILKARQNALREP